LNRKTIHKLRKIFIFSKNNLMHASGYQKTLNNREQSGILLNLQGSKSCLLKSMGAVWSL
jgi:hypothetical protein